MTLPLSDRARPWDAAAAKKRVADWASAGGSINFGKYGSAFAVKGDGKTVGSYKLPFADVIGGTLTAVWSGVTAAAAALQGARGGVSGDTGGAKSILAAYYAAARKKYGDDKIQVPWKESNAMPQRETRLAPLTFDRDEHGFLARLVSYGPADSYKTRWAPGVFDESVRGHMPVLAWGHNWADPIGRMDDYDDRSEGPYGHFRLDDGDYVPRAKQALYQLKSGTLTDVSVGILRRADNPEEDGTTTITRADLDETSLVLRGAVPGAQVQPGSIRSGQGIGFDDVVELARRVRSGQLSEADALATLNLLGGSTDLGAVVSTGSQQTIARSDAKAAEIEIRAALAEADELALQHRW